MDLILALDIVVHSYTCLMTYLCESVAEYGDHLVIEFMESHSDEEEKAIIKCEGKHGHW